MEPWKERFVHEYKELKECHNKLCDMLEKYKNGTLDFTPKCSYELLDHQADVMGEYIAVLLTIARIEDISLS